MATAGVNLILLKNVFVCFLYNKCNNNDDDNNGIL